MPRPARRSYDPRLSARNLVEIVREATTKENMPWLKDSDQAMIELAVKTAQAIEDAAAGDDAAAAMKAVGWLGPQLQNCLKSLGATPMDRKALTHAPQTEGRLAELRSASRRGRTAPVDKAS